MITKDDTVTIKLTPEGMNHLYNTGHGVRYTEHVGRIAHHQPNTGFKVIFRDGESIHQRDIEISEFYCRNLKQRFFDIVDPKYDLNQEKPNMARLTAQQMKTLAWTGSCIETIDSAVIDLETNQNTSEQLIEIRFKTSDKSDRNIQVRLDSFIALLQDRSVELNSFLNDYGIQYNDENKN